MPASSARNRARQLARHGTFDRASPPLVCPLVLAQGAEIEALPAGQFLTDPTKLANGLRALHGAFGTDVIVTAAADDLAECSLAAAAAGALAAAAAGHPRVTAAVEVSGPPERIGTRASINRCMAPSGPASRVKR